MELCARGDLNPIFRVLFSAIFHGVSLGISIRVENYGIEHLRTKFSAVFSRYPV
jgi:hypothetical protein